jgi:hypothetical protein
MPDAKPYGVTEAHAPAESTAVVSKKDHSALRLMVRELARITEEDGGDSNDFIMGLMDKILSAGSEEEIFASAESGMVAGKDFAGRPFYLRREDISWKKASQGFIDGGAFPFYAIFTVTEIVTGQEATLDTGGKSLVAQLFALYNTPNDRIKDDLLDPVKYPNGRPLVIMSHESDAGAYITLRPVVQKDSGDKPVSKSSKSKAD